MTERVAAQSATFVRASKPGSDEFFGTAQDRLRVQSGEAQSFLRFRVEVPPGKMLSTAVLDMRAEETFVGGATARSVDPDAGAYRNMTWNTRHATVSGSADRAAVVSGRDLVFPVTDDVNTAIAADQTRVAFKIAASSTTRQWLVGPDGGRGWPRLLLTFVSAPVVPTDLAPAGVVSKAKSWHQWLGHPDADQVQLQFAAEGAAWDAVTGFTTPTLDTGAWPTTADAVDMAVVSPGWVGLADAEVAEWTVRQRLPSGWGPWAPPATMERAVKVDPVITNPLSVTADSSPPIEWTPPPGQVAWQVLVDINGDDMQDDSGKRAGTDSEYVPDMGGDDPGTVYRIRVRTWDGYDRVVIPGDPPYGEAELYTTFTPTDTVAPLTTFNITQVPGLPAVRPTWARATGLPDYVDLTAAGAAHTQLPGLDSGEQVWTFPPNQDLAVIARAVVNGEQSETAITRNLRTMVGGVWLVDPETGRGCVLSGVDGLSIEYGDVSVVHTPIDGAVLLRRTLVVRGLEGTIKGRIDDWPGRTHKQQVDDVMWLRDRSRRVLRLIMGDLNIPVVCTSLQALFDAEASFVDRLEHNVSFAFSHAGGR